MTENYLEMMEDDLEIMEDDMEIMEDDQKCQKNSKSEAFWRSSLSHQILTFIKHLQLAKKPYRSVFTIL
jgi:hypothetical protein